MQVLGEQTGLKQFPPLFKPVSNTRHVICVPLVCGLTNFSRCYCILKTFNAFEESLYLWSESRYLYSWMHELKQTFFFIIIYRENDVFTGCCSTVIDSSHSQLVPKTRKRLFLYNHAIRCRFRILPRRFICRISMWFIRKMAVFFLCVR